MAATYLALLLAASAVTARAAAAECAAHPGCAGLEGNCCPADNGIQLACCSPGVVDNGNGGSGGSDNGATVGGCAASEYGCCHGSESAATGPNGEGCVDPSGCAVDITAGIAAITSASKNINYAVEDCADTSSTASKRACADDITSSVTDFGGASKAIASAVNTCGGQQQACANDIINSATSLSAATESLISASTDCEEGNAGYDSFSCIVDIFDTVDTLVHASKSIYDAVDHCAPASAGAADASERRLAVNV